MNKTLEHLARICQSHQLEEKTLIVPSYAGGHQLIEALVLQGVSVVNLRATTARGLALETAAPALAERGIKVLSEEAILAAVEEVFKTEIHGHEGLYFGSLEPTPGIISAVAASIKDLRLAGLSSKDLMQDQFIVTDKYNGVRTVLRGYEDFLARNSAADDAEMLRLATSLVSHSTPASRVVVALPSFPVTHLEKLFAETYSGHSLVVLDDDPVLELEKPRLAYKPGESADGPGGRFSWLFAPQKCPHDGNPSPIEFFHAIGCYNEFKEILRRVLKGSIPFDAVEIACADYSRYALLAFSEQQKHAVQITYSEGIPITHTAPGKALLGFLEWIGSNFKVTSLRDLLSMGVLKMPEHQGVQLASAQEVVRILRSARIGWGRDRYLPLLDKFKESRDVRATAESLEEGERKGSGWTPERLRRIDWVIWFVEALLAYAPDFDAERMVTTANPAKYLKGFLTEFGLRATDLDRLAYASAASVLDESDAASSAGMTVDDFCERIKLRLGSLRVGASGPKPGHIHLASMRKAGFAGRQYTFVPGLDERTFPGTVLEDPILLDDERTKISEHLATSRDEMIARQHRMYSFLASLRGGVTFSYSSYDVSEAREMSPSAVILHARRVHDANPALDYSGLKKQLGPAVSYLRQMPLDPSDWWLEELWIRKRPGSTRKQVLSHFPHLARGEEAERARDGDLFTEFYGKVKVEPAIDDPRRNHTLVLSSSALETLAGCPFQYFVERVLGLQAPDDLEYDPGAWLDAMERGSLLHSIYEKFLRALSKQGERVSAKKHGSLIATIAETEISKLKDLVPPPSEVIFQAEKRDIVSSLEIFLKMEEAQAASAAPRYFEVSFGKGKKAGDELAVPDPVRIDIGKSYVLLRGVIDRIDELEQHKYRVVDYKTGGSHKYSERQYFDGGRQLQHALYAIVAEEILRGTVDKRATVVEAGYYFPTSKGGLQHIMRNRRPPEAMQYVLDLLLGLIRRGTFLPAEKECYLCRDYHLCGENKTRHNAMIENPLNRELESVRKLKETT